MKISALRAKIVARINADHHFVRSASGTTSYMSAGTGKPVVLIHGAGGGGISWAPVIGPLARHFQVIVPDVIGYGESDKPNGAYDKSFFAAWLRDFITSLGLTGPAVIGSSQGGAIALQTGLEYPEIMTNLILANPAGLGPQRLPLTPLFWMFLANIFPSRKIFKKLVPYLTVKPARLLDRDQSRYLGAVARSKGASRVFWQGRGRVVKPFAMQELRGLRLPTLIIWGEQDRLFSLAAAKQGADNIPQVRFTILEDAGHMPYIDQPENFVAEIIKFLIHPTGNRQP